MMERHTNGETNPEELELRLEQTRADIDDTLEALQRKLSPGELVDEAITYLRTGPGEFTSNLTETIKNNPVPTSLIGIGIAWLMVSKQGTAGTRFSYDDELDPGFDPDFDYGREQDSTLGAVGGKLSGAGRRVKSGAKSAARSLRHAASEVRDAAVSVGSTTAEAAETAASAASKVGRAGSSAVGRAGDALGSARAAAQDVWQSRDRLSSGTRRASRSAARASRELGSTMRRHPAVVGLLAIAAGGLCAAMIPSTHREDELMGEASDRAYGRARREAKEQLEAAKEKVASAADAAVGAAKDDLRSERTFDSAGGRAVGRTVGRSDSTQE